MSAPEEEPAFERYGARVAGHWREYVVSKRIRQNAKNVHLGIFWQPGHENDWLQIRNVRVFIEP